MSVAAPLHRLVAALLGAALLGAALLACQHAPALAPGARCDSFPDFSAATQRQLEVLLAEAPGDQLLAEASRLNRERRACARQVLATLRERREAGGVEAVQRELDALVATYRPDDLDALLADALGADATPLRPLLAEARVRFDRERRAGEARRRDVRAARRDDADATALDGLAKQQVEADREAVALLREQEAERRRADRDAAAHLPRLDGAREDADKEARALATRLDAASDHADRDAATASAQLDAARARADEDAARWTTAAAGSTGAELAPMRAADDVTAEALRGLDGTPSAAGPCAAANPCVRLDCAELSAAQANTSARACLDRAAGLTLDARAALTAGVVAGLRRFPPTPSATEALTLLETTRRLAWPAVEAAARRGQHGLAAQRASPFLALDGARAEVQRLRDVAQAQHLRRAQALAPTPVAAWLHAKLAETFGGPVAPPSPPNAGRWGPTRWRCDAPAPGELPEVPPGLAATLQASCPAPGAAQDSGALRTFDLGLTGRRVEGFLVVSCADHTQSSPFRVEEPGLEGLPTAALTAELTRLLGLAQRRCGELHALAALRECAELRQRAPAELTRRYTLHAWATGAWATCFSEWLIATEGAAPPSLR